VKNETYLKLIILILGIFIIHACSTLDKLSKEVVDNPNDSSKSTMDEFETIKMNTPCWINTNPKNCPDYQNENNKFMYIKSKMVTEKLNDKMTDQQYETIQKKISFQYFKLLNKEIKNELFTKYSQCKERRDLCNQKFNEYKSSQELMRSHFEIIDHYWRKLNAQWELNVLVAISYEDFYMDKKKIINDKILKKIPLLPKRRNNNSESELIWIDRYDSSNSITSPSPSEMTDIFKFPTSKYIYEQEESAKCEDFKLKFTDIPSHFTHNDCISSIQNDLKNIYASRRNGAYFDYHVLETNSECTKRKNGCTTDHDYNLVEDEIEKKYNRIVNCWQNRIKLLDTDYIKKKKDALLQYKMAHHNVIRFNHLLSEWSYQMDVQLKNNEQKKLTKEMYSQKLKLVNSYYLVFTIANTDHKIANLQLIRRYSVKSAINEIFSQIAKYNILKNILLEKSIMKNDRILTNYNIRITQDYVNKLKIIPRTYIAKIMKFKVGLSLNPKKILSIEERPELPERKIKSFIISGNEDIVLDNTLRPINQAQLKDKVYNNWKEIAFKNTIHVTEEQKKIIQFLIYDVIDDNIKAKKTAIRFRNEYIDEIKYIDKTIQDNKKLIT